MFVKLTRLDSSPIWINASFVVTVEPRKGGGSIVVPIGDGLDYDVRETPEAVLAALAGAPAPAVVPVPAPKGLAPSQGDVSPDDFSSVDPLPAKPAPHERKAARKASVEDKGKSDSSEAGRGASPMRPSENSSAPQPAAEPDPADVFAGVVPPPAAEKPAAHPRTRKPRAATARKAAAPAAPVAEVVAGAVAKTTPLDLGEDDLARLRKLAPSSVRKLQNTLLSQFHVADSTVTITALEERGVLTLDRDHVIWK